MFAKLLVANRGEIAVRIIAAARAMGIATVAVFSDADAGALHVRLADESHRIGPAPARDSYLDIGAIVDAAVASGAEAVHPGYGFLSENAELAAAVEAAGLVFVGPRPATIALMSDKVAARAAAIAAGVPVLPGSDGPVADPEAARALAAGIGFPIAVKASFGGGGRGLRVAQDAAALAAAMESARRESEAAFGRSEIFLERYLARPRHIEVQVLGDAHGHVVHLGDRDCSVQRRHQKLIEEAPAPRLEPAVRAAILDAAVSLARSVDYLGAGTIEFLLDPDDGSFFFLEMNTRLQVEHGVTELVTGVDIVEAQIAIAAGRPLGFGQEDVTVTGHAVQARIAAEDAWDGFRPTPGTIDRLDVPLLPWVRVDFGVQAGDRVEPHYDSLIGKLLAWGPDRAAAVGRLTEALRRFRTGGIPTTAPYLAELLAQPAFVAARHDTGSLERDWVLDASARPPVAAETVTPSGSAERHVILPGPPPRRVAIFGKAQRAPLAAVAGIRAARADTAGAGFNPATRENELAAPMDGILVQHRVEAGAAVEEGAPLLVLEAMKMEVVLPAPFAAVVRRLCCEAGEAVRKGQVLIELDPRG